MVWTCTWKLWKICRYALTTYKNGADVWKSLKQDKLIAFTPTKLDENPTPMQKEMWRIHANNTIKHEELLEANLEAIYEVVLSICNAMLKVQVCNHEDYEDFDNKNNTLGLLRCIKKILYYNGDDDMHMGYNHVIAITNYYHIQQERYQSLQDYHDRFTAYRKVCEQQALNDMFSEDDYEGFAFVQDVTCNMNDKARIPDSRILLDSQSIMDVFMNKKVLKNISYAKKALSLHCNAGLTTVNKIGDLPGYDTVWFY